MSTQVDSLLAPRLEQRILPGLDRVRTALEALGHPEDAVPSLHIVGTNGKGSTAALLASVVHAHGARVGLYTSPHLVDVEERIVVDGATITPERLAASLVELGRFPELSYFEVLTAAALAHFARERVDIAVLEAGLGGRWDATNVGEPVVTMLTNVGTDHQAWLGESRTAIAAEKAAALRGREAIVGAWDDEVEPTIRAGADASTPISLASHWSTVTVDRGPWAVGRTPTGANTDTLCPLSPVPCPPPIAGTPVTFEVTGVSGSAHLPLQGKHQLANLGLALAGAVALAKHSCMPPLRAEAIIRGIESTRWPGRLHWVAAGDTHLLLDGAHNREAVVALAEALDQLGLSGRIHLLFSCLEDKPLAEMAEHLRGRVTGVTLAPLDSPRASDLGTLAAAFPGAQRAAGIAQAIGLLPNDRPTLVTGSLRLVGEVLRLLSDGQACPSRPRGAG